MDITLSASLNYPYQATVAITGSKSESNRLLLLQALYPNIEIENLSNADDALVMAQGLKKKNGVVDIHHAGTAMRFLTAFFASRDGCEITLTGSERMTERPIRILVETLRGLGADIKYTKAEGYPPLRIKGKILEKNKATIPANVSSQYISALLLIAGSLEHGLELELQGKITSVPYINMTLGLLTRLGIDNQFSGNTVRVYPAPHIAPANITVESDWSSASYFYSLVALSHEGTEIELTSYRENSLQGDSILSSLYKDFGVETHFKGNRITLKKTAAELPEKVKYHLADAPDLAQTLAVSSFGLGVGCHLTGLHTLKIKETDRLVALERELGKLGADIRVTDNSLTLQPGGTPANGVAIDTYNDHRMAMAFAPLALKTSLIIRDSGVVSKSYPDFWSDMKSLGIKIEESK